MTQGRPEDKAETARIERLKALSTPHTADAAKLFVVLGDARDVEAWRREHGLSRRAVIAVAPARYTGALRGLTLSEYEIVTLDSWGGAPAWLVAEIERDIALATHTARQPQSAPPSPPPPAQPGTTTGLTEAMREILRSGATVLVVQPGERLVLVSSSVGWVMAEADVDAMLGEVKKFFPANEIGILLGFDQVVKWESTPGTAITAAVAS